jgi:hypothetical protein
MDNGVNLPAAKREIIPFFRRAGYRQNQSGAHGDQPMKLWIGAIGTLLIFLWLKGPVPFLQIASYSLVDGIEGRAQLRDEH